MGSEIPSYSSAAQMAARQRNISVSEFFLKNRHLLGFDSPSRALLTTVKEAVDNALDACEEAGILPELRVQIDRLDEELFRIVVEDNGPGIVEKQLAYIFGKLLYGSKFHKLSQSRGQQGMGISAVGMYAQLTTGKPLHVLSRVRGEKQATEVFISVDTTHNRPEIHSKQRVSWPRHTHGTRVTAEIVAHEARGRYSVHAYLMQTAIANPHVTIRYIDSSGEQVVFKRSSSELPQRPRNIKPHPRGVELGMLIQMLNSTRYRTLEKFLINEFSRVGRKTAEAIIHRARYHVSARSYPRRIGHAKADALYRAMQKVPVSAPPTDCIVPIGEALLEKSLRKEIAADIYLVHTRPAAVYRGNPFQVEVGIAYGQPGGNGLVLDLDGHIRRAAVKAGSRDLARAPANETVHILRYANRVPLLHEQQSCAITRAVMQTNWKAYGLQQSRGNLPVAPMAIVVHVASVWVPFTSEAKEAIASYPEIIRELKLGLQECGRRLASHIRHDRKLQEEYDKRIRIEKYLPHVGMALQSMLGLSDKERDAAMARLDDTLHRKRQLG